MDNRILGGILIAVCVLLGITIWSFNTELAKNADASCGCSEMNDAGFCPHSEQGNWQTTLGIALASAMAALGAYLIFFEKSQKAIITALETSKKEQSDTEKFEILLKGLTEDEKNVLSSVKEQDGITQQTLRLRTGLHKSKLSIVLDGLEKKGIIARQDQGKTRQVFLKIAL